MKKFLVLAMIAFAAAGFTACDSDDSGSSDSSKADLKWKNEHSSEVAEIKWIHDGQEDQSWGGTFGNGDETGFKGITELSGSGECQEGGATAEIELDTQNSTGTDQISASSAVIKENADAVLIISAAKKK